MADATNLDQGPRTARGRRPGGTASDRPTRHELALLGFAALSVVMAHRYQPVFLFFPVHAFHLGLVFAAAGHLAVAAPARDLPTRLRSEALSWFGLAYAANLGLALLTLGLYRAGLSPGGAVPSLASAEAALGSLRTFLLAPLGLAEGYALFQSAWILGHLGLASVLFQLLARAQSRAVLGSALLGSSLAAAALLDQGGSGGPLLLWAGRVAFALAFYLAGHLLATASEVVRRRLLAPAATVVCFLCADALGAAFGGLGYDLDRGTLGGRPGFVSILGTAVLVLLVDQLAHHAARIVGDRSALLAIGRSWRAILIGHQAAFFATNCAFVLLGALKADQLSGTSSFNLNKTWLLYLIPALALPVLGRRAAARLAKRPAPA